METNIEQIDYERGIIIRLLKTKTPKEIANQLSEAMFTNFQYRKIFKHCIELINKDGFIDIYALTGKMKSQEQQKLLDSLEKELCVTANYRFYVEKLHQAYFDRLIQQARTVEEMELIQKEIDKWTDISIIKPISYKSENLLTDYYDKWETSIKTGFKNIDNIIGSLQSGDFLIFAGATSSGKTMCALNIMLNIAKQGHKCTFYSLEMSLPQLQNRIISCETGINSAGFRTFTLTPEEQKRHLQYSQDVLPKLPINICIDYKGLTVDKITSIEKKSDSEIVFIDYLGLLKSDVKGSQYEKVTELSTAIKRCAMEVNKPFFVLHQLSRNFADRQDKRPCLSDLRGSGQLEQDADMVLFVHRPYYFDDKADPTDLEIIVGKNRHGENNKVLPFSYLSGQQKIVERGIISWNKKNF